MDFEKEAREIAEFVWGDTEYVPPPDEIAFIVAILRRAYAAGQENMKGCCNQAINSLRLRGIWDDKDEYIDAALERAEEAVSAIPLEQEIKK